MRRRFNRNPQYSPFCRAGSGVQEHGRRVLVKVRNLAQWPSPVPPYAQGLEPVAKDSEAKARVQLDHPGRTHDAGDEAEVGGRDVQVGRGKAGQVEDVDGIANFGTTLSTGFASVESTRFGHSPRWEKGTLFAHIPHVEQELTEKRSVVVVPAAWRYAGISR